MADIERVAKAVETLLEWRVHVEADLRTFRKHLERYEPLVDAMIEADKIADAIKEHNNLTREQVEAKKATEFTHAQVYAGFVLLVVGSVGVPILLHFL